MVRQIEKPQPHQRKGNDGYALRVDRKVAVRKIYFRAVMRY